MNFELCHYHIVFCISCLNVELSTIVYKSIVNSPFMFCISSLVFHDTHFCQIIWQIFTQGRAKKFRQNSPPVGLNPWPLYHHAKALWSGAWNKAYIRNLLSNIYQAGTVSRALEWWSSGSGFNPDWGKLLTIFFALPLCTDKSDNLTETRIVKNPIVIVWTSIQNGSRI